MTQDKSIYYKDRIKNIKEDVLFFVILMPEIIIENTPENEEIYDVIKNIINNTLLKLVTLNILEDIQIMYIFEQYVNDVDVIFEITDNEIKIKAILDYIDIIFNKLKHKAIKYELYEIAQNVDKFYYFTYDDYLQIKTNLTE